MSHVAGPLPVAGWAAAAARPPAHGVLLEVHSLAEIANVKSAI